MNASTSRVLAGLAFSAFALALSCRGGCGRDKKGGAGDEPPPPAPPTPPPAEPPPPLPGSQTLYPKFPVPLTGPDAFVWQRENRVTSTDTVDGKTTVGYYQVKMPYLAENAQRCLSRHFDVEGKTALAGNFKQYMFAEGQNVLTRDQFDQVQVCYSLHMEYGLLAHVGFPMDELFQKPLQVKVNFLDQLNAFYSPVPNEERLEFGNGKDDKTGVERFHTGSDGDIPGHEFGHAFVHKQNPWLILPFGGEGRAIHEAMGDMIASFTHGNPFMSEDFSRHIGLPEGKDSALRICRNELTLAEAGDEAHARGRSFCGFGWMGGFERDLERRVGREKGRILGLQLAGNHVANYSASFSVTPRDFVEAYKRGAAALAREGKLPEGITLGEIVQMIDQEGQRRGMLEPLPAPPPDDGGDVPPEEDIKAMGPEDIDPYTGKDLHAIRGQYRARSNSGTIFDDAPSHVAKYIGGRTEYHRQYYPIQSDSLQAQARYAEVLGRTLIVRKDGSGRTLDIHEDVRTIKKGDISETVSVSWRKAVQAAQRKIEAELHKLLEAEKVRPLTREEGGLKRALAACRGGTDFQQAMCLSATGTAKRIRPAYVILGDNKTLSYAIDLKFGIVYVPTNREPTAENMLFQGRVFQ